MMDDLACISKCGIDTIEMNAYINAKIEQKNLKFNEVKCHKLHIKANDKNTDNCPDVNVHDNKIIKSSKEKYLGDVISSNGKNAENIKVRAASGIGITASIKNILNDLSLGTFYFEAALLLREANFMNSILLNSETWVNLNKTDIEELENVDKKIKL